MASLHDPSRTPPVSDACSQDAPNIDGLISTAAGEIIWCTQNGKFGRVHLVIVAPSPAHQTLVATITFRSNESMQRHLARVLSSFERTTMAQWDHPVRTRITVRRSRGWNLTYTRTPGFRSTLTRTRRVGPANGGNGWDRFKVVSVAVINPLS
jgi:hypothetical protein